MGSKYLAYVLNDYASTLLVDLFGSKYPNTKAHHVTVVFDNTSSDEQLAELLEDLEAARRPDSVEIYAIGEKPGRCHAAAVRINGRCVRDDGKLYHVTLSVANGAKPVESNDIDHWEQLSTHWVLQGEFQLLAK